MTFFRSIKFSFLFLSFLNFTDSLACAEAAKALLKNIMTKAYEKMPIAASFIKSHKKACAITALSSLGAGFCLHKIKTKDSI